MRPTLFLSSSLEAANWSRWRLLPKERLKRKASEELFEIEGYVTELRVPQDKILLFRHDADGIKFEWK